MTAPAPSPSTAPAAESPRASSCSSLSPSKPTLARLTGLAYPSPTRTVRMISQRVQSMLRMTMADMADAADALDGAFRLENADTWLTPPEHVLRATREAVGVDDCNSYLPLRGLRVLREAIAARYGGCVRPRGRDRGLVRRGESLLNALLVLIDPGDRVLLTNPTYSGMAQRVRLAGGVQVFAPLVVSGGRWSLDLDAWSAPLAAAASSSSPRPACRWARCSPPRRPPRSSAWRPRTTPGSCSTGTPTRSPSTGAR